jgi:hypothetical protein
MLYIRASLGFLGLLGTKTYFFRQRGVWISTKQARHRTVPGTQHKKAAPGGAVLVINSQNGNKFSTLFPEILALNK